MKVIKNYLYNISFQLINIILPIITIPYITRIFLSEQLGEYGFYNSIASYFTLLSMLGLNIYGTKAIAESKQNLKSVFWNIYGIQLFFSLLSIAIYIITILLIPKMNNEISKILLFLLIAKVFDVSWLFSGLEDFRIISIRNAGVKLCGAILVFSLLNSSSSIIGYVIILTLSELIGQLIMWPSVYKLVGKPIRSIPIINSHLKPIITLFLPRAAVSLYTILDRSLLGILSNYSDVAIYEQGQKIIMAIMVLVGSLGTVLLPRISELLSKKKIKETYDLLNFSFKFYNIIIFPIVIGFIIVNKEFVELFYGNEFANVYYVLLIMIFKVPFVGWGNILSLQILVPWNRNSKLLSSVSWPAFVSIFLNLLLIPNLGFIGASLSSLLTEIMVCAFQYWYSRDVVKNLKPFKSIGKIILSSFLMGLCCYVFRQSITNKFISIVGSIVVGLFSYLIFIHLFKVISMKEIKMELGN